MDSWRPDVSDSIILDIQISVLKLHTISSLMLVIFSWIFSVYVLPVFHADWMLMLRFDIVVVTALDTLDRGSFISVCEDAPLHSAPGHDPVANGIGGEV